MHNKFLCAHCGENSVLPTEMWLDSGSTLECTYCQKETVFDLDKPEDRAKRYAIYSAAISFVKADNATDRGTALNSLHAAVDALGLSGLRRPVRCSGYPLYDGCHHSYGHEGPCEPM